MGLVRLISRQPTSRHLTRTLHGGEPVALTGRPGGTDEFLGRGGFTPSQGRTGNHPDACVTRARLTPR
jgi:hypothetical protein